MKSTSSVTPIVASSSARRLFLSRSGQLTLSAAAICMLAGANVPAYAKSPKAAASDVSALNVLLSLEHEGINAYTLGAKSGLLQKPALDTALLFQARHKSHRDTLIALIEKMGGKPDHEKTLDEYAKELNAASLKTQLDVLTFATGLELGAANAYLSLIPSFKDNKLAELSGRLAADETVHYTALLQATGQPLPTKALVLGA